MVREVLPMVVQPRRCSCCGSPINAEGKALTPWPAPDVRLSMGGKLIGKAVDPLIPPITNLEEPV